MVDNDILTHDNIRQVLQEYNVKKPSDNIFINFISGEAAYDDSKIITDEQLIHLENMIYKASHGDETVEYNMNNNTFRLTWNSEQKQFLSYYHITEILSYTKVCKELTRHLNGRVNSISTPTDHLYYSDSFRDIGLPMEYNKQLLYNLIIDVQFTKEFVIKHTELLINQRNGNLLITYKKVNETYEWHTIEISPFNPYFEGEICGGKAMDYLCHNMILQYLCTCT